MRNNYAGTCFVCNHRVEAGQGHFTKQGGGGKWRVKHWWHGDKVSHTSKAKKAEREFLNSLTN